MWRKTRCAAILPRGGLHQTHAAKKENNKMKKLMLALAVAIGSHALAADSLHDGLVAYYKLDGDANDSSGNGNHGTLMTIYAGFTLDRYWNWGGAGEFGSGGWIEVPSSESLDTVTNALTLSFWVDVGSFVNGIVPIFGSSKADSQFCCYFADNIERGVVGGNGASFWGHGGAENDFALGCEFPFTGWCHFVVIFADGMTKIYLNGELIATKTGCSFPYAKGSDIIIGKTGYLKDSGDESYLNGRLDDIRIYNRALAADEVAAIHELETPPTKYWTVIFDFNDGSGKTVELQVEHGQVIDPDSMPWPDVPLGYDFQGWFNDPADWYPANIWEEPICYDRTLYARTERNPNAYCVDGCWFMAFYDMEWQGYVINTFLGIEKPCNFVLPETLNGEPIVGIVDWLFFEQSGITNVVLNHGMKFVGEFAFANCIGLMSVSIPGTLERVERYAFHGCIELANVQIGHGVRELCENCFGAPLLTSVSLPSSVVNIESSAFGDCRALSCVRFNGSRPLVNGCDSAGIESEKDGPFGSADGIKFYVLNDLGWKDADGTRIAKWCSKEVIYAEPFADIGETATPQDVTDVLAGSADAKLYERIWDARQYAQFRAWVGKLCGANEGERQAVKDAPYSWLSFALDADALITTPPAQGDLSVSAFAKSSAGASFDMELSLAGLLIGKDATADNLAAVFSVEGCERLGSGFSADTLTADFATPTDGKTKVTITPKNESADSFFVRALLKGL